MLPKPELEVSLPPGSVKIEIGSGLARSRAVVGALRRSKKPNKTKRLERIEKKCDYFQKTLALFFGSAIFFLTFFAR
jgi:hypothetical protein